MSAAAGVILVMLGSIGIAYGICREYQTRLLLLKQIRSSYAYIQYEMAYGKTPIPQILLKLAEKQEGCFQEEFLQVAEEMQTTGEDFTVIWNRVFAKALEHTVLKKREQEMLLCFADKQGLARDEAQARTLDELLLELTRYIEEVQEEQKSRNKVVMSIGMAGGLLLCILLL